MLAPVALGLREKYPNHHIHLVTDPTYMDGVLVRIAARNPWWHTIYDRPIAISTTTQTAETQGIPMPGNLADDPLIQRAAFALDLNNVCALTENALTDPPHRTRIWCAAAGVEPSDMRPIYRVTSWEASKSMPYVAERGWLNAWSDGKLIGIAPVSADPARSLPSASTREIMDALRDAGYLPVMLDHHRSVEGHEFVNGMDFNRLAAVISRMSAVVAVDSGLLHVAGALRVPLLGLFGSIPAAKRMEFYHGRALQATVPCGPCWYGKGCANHPDPATWFACMKGFSGERVVKEVEILLAGNDPSKDAVV